MRTPDRTKDALILEIAGANHAVITSADCNAIRVSANVRAARVAERFMTRVGHGLYVVEQLRTDLTPFAMAQTRDRDLAAAGLGAAWLWRLDGLDSPAPAVPEHRRVRAADVRQINGFRVLAPLPLLVSLGPLVGPDLLEAAVESALRRRLTTEEQLDRAAGRRTMLRAVLDARGRGTPPTESYLETLVLQRILRPWGLGARRQVNVFDQRGEFLGRYDFELSSGLLLEANGAAWHATRSGRRRDSWRAASLRLAGRQVEDVTWDDVRWMARDTGARLHERNEQLLAQAAFPVQAALRAPAAARPAATAATGIVASA